MQEILTANAASNLYWLGRHLKRVESFLLEIDKVYDTVIDVDFDAGVHLGKQLGITLHYQNASDFLHQAVLADHTLNCKSLMSYAKENAIISRSFINLDAFGSIIQLDKLFLDAVEQNRTIDYIFIDEVLSLISEIWGELTRKQQRYLKDYFLLLGKNVEKVDFHLRTGKSNEYAMIIMEEIDTTVSILAPDANFTPHDASEKPLVILESINNKINKIIEY